MTGRRRIRSTFLPTLHRPVRATALAAGALAVCASLTTGCGVIPGATGGSGDDPIKVMTWASMNTDATNKPGMPAMAQAYARWVNAHGGINGRKLTVLVCNDRNDTITAAGCAQRAADEEVVAVVGSYSQFGDTFFSTLESADIPYIGGYGITNAEFDSPLSYPVNGGQPSLLAGLGKELGADCGPVALVRPDSIAGDELHVMLDSGLKAAGHPAAADQLAAEDATEYGAQSERALDRTTGDPGKKGCVVPALGDRTSTFMDSFRRAREDYPDVRTATVLGSVDQTVVNATGGASGPYEGSYVAGWYPVATDPRWDAMKKVIKEQAFDDNRIDPADAGVQTTWLAYTVFRAAVESLGDGEVTSTAVRKALDGGLKVNTGGLTPTLDWDYDNGLAAVGLPRLFNTEVTLQAVREGRLVTAREGFTDVRATLENADVG
ncbi:MULTISPECIES: ABC transporter substrate-binding protein [unclassified Streptomyces]|uniref:ABC transporter substrate-binding protein n=1 Tax=unclassified Streptomyces TaxID=2593676 RepID=UPI0036EF109F